MLICPEHAPGEVLSACTTTTYVTHFMSCHCFENWHERRNSEVGLSLIDHMGGRNWKISKYQLDMDKTIKTQWRRRDTDKLRKWRHSGRQSSNQWFLNYCLLWTWMMDGCKSMFVLLPSKRVSCQSNPMRRSMEGVLDFSNGPGGCVLYDCPTRAPSRGNLLSLSFAFFW